MLAPVRVSAPVAMPVSLAEAKAHLRVDHNDDDALITALIAAAVDHLDGWTGILGRCLVEQEWRQDFDAFALCLPLPLGPVIEIVGVASGADTMDASAYSLKTDAGGRSRVEFSGISVSGPVSVTYRAGYATIPEVPADGETPAVPAQSTVPPALKVAILLLVSNWYANHEVSSAPVMIELPFAVSAFVAPYRRIIV